MGTVLLSSAPLISCTCVYPCSLKGLFGLLKKIRNCTKQCQCILFSLRYYVCVYLPGRLICSFKNLSFFMFEYRGVDFRNSGDLSALNENCPAYSANVQIGAVTREGTYMEPKSAGQH